MASHTALDQSKELCDEKAKFVLENWFQLEGVRIGALEAGEADPDEKAQKLAPNICFFFLNATNGKSKEAVSLKWNCGALHHEVVPNTEEVRTALKKCLSPESVFANRKHFVSFTNETVHMELSSDEKFIDVYTLVPKAIAVLQGYPTQRVVDIQEDENTLINGFAGWIASEMALLHDDNVSMGNLSLSTIFHIRESTDNSCYDTLQIAGIANHCALQGKSTPADDVRAIGELTRDLAEQYQSEEGFTIGDCDEECITRQQFSSVCARLSQLADTTAETTLTLPYLLLNRRSEKCVEKLKDRNPLDAKAQARDWKKDMEKYRKALIHQTAVSLRGLARDTTTDWKYRNLPIPPGIKYRIITWLRQKIEFLKTESFQYLQSFFEESGRDAVEWLSCFQYLVDAAEDIILRHFEQYPHVRDLLNQEWNELERQKLLLSFSDYSTPFETLRGHVSNLQYKTEPWFDEWLTAQSKTRDVNRKSLRTLRDNLRIYAHEFHKQFSRSDWDEESRELQDLYWQVYHETRWDNHY